ncbi:unnamed protein product [Phytophthora lilii]|uniref:Unnamed protein product n=1 Tax=Phytophthora lilii TaxID=2077276 RepID=A0A9W6TJU3_9STRA|nr:unnamed protein product [Phytophthora lilii]
MLPFASWNVMFVEMVKMSKGDLQDRAATAEAAAMVSNTVTEAQEEKYSAVAAHIKVEQAAASTTATAAALGNLSITGNSPAAALPARVEQPVSQAKRLGGVHTPSIVDLTLDDESDSHTSTSSASSRRSSQPHIKEEVHVKTESAWLASATTAQESPIFDVDELMDKTMGEDEDPILRTMIGEYNQLSEKIFDIDQEFDSHSKKTKELSSAQPINMQEVLKARNKTKKLRREKVEAEKSRDGVVANIVVYLKSDAEEFKAFLETCTSDVPYAQTASHRKCASMEASIRSNLENIQRVQRNMEELINLKKDAFAEVTRLGAEIAQGEQEVRNLDMERQEEFLRLCQFSKAIQTAVRDMADSTQ